MLIVARQPVEIVLHNPVVMSASGPAYRLIVTLAAVFWCGGCRALPEDEAGLCALARCGASTWRKEKGVVLDALRQAIPQFERHHTRAVQRAEINRQVRAEAGRKGAVVRWQKPKATANQNFGLIDDIPTTLRVPVKSAPGKGPIVKREQPVAANSRFGDE